MRTVRGQHAVAAAAREGRAKVGACVKWYLDQPETLM
ncbi:ATP dependent RNA helicase [Aspergillus luchuensis]|uniref:ATP dependent RNA helicase n=1 Tax=Aspergillus kawachii TaxID=1069201 RepID=A0A146FZH7_ASPKA|nr:ATP dependent RNA helicase [Aspergillus luchuensis]